MGSPTETLCRWRCEDCATEVVARSRAVVDHFAAVHRCPTPDEMRRALVDHNG